MIRRVIRGGELPAYDGNEVEGHEPEPTNDLSDASLITSEIDTDSYFILPSKGERLHAPVLDLDLNAALIPSSTPGHFHLYLDKAVPEDKYFALLDSLADAGIIEEGYAKVSKDRGYTAVRLPWVQK